MEATIYKGQAHVYNPTTHKIVKSRNWRGKYTKEQVLEWMQQRDKFLRDVNEFDTVMWGLWEDDGCYRMAAIRNDKKSKAGRHLKPMMVRYTFYPAK
jgi:hypothetical protein